MSITVVAAQQLQHTHVVPTHLGTTMLEALGILQPFERDLLRAGHNSPMYIHLVTEASKHAFADLADAATRVLTLDVAVSNVFHYHAKAQVTKARGAKLAEAIENFGTAVHQIRQTAATALRVPDSFA